MYSTYEQYTQEFKNDQIPNDDGEARIIRAIEKASRLADSYIRAGGLSSPLIDQEAIEDIKGHVLDISRYYLWNENPTDEQRRRFEDAVRWLEGLASGRNRLRTSTQESRKSGFHNVRLIRS
ncbi:phage protein Gp36 family protein [Stutzerimonas nitrititolerans]|uniref:phage protein Gp36 family protein n=1 Tax=Stutzerimonas nitrititolerans TaxID=2482751 RepID=UPI00289E92D1|nr:phage protein Gp36 family protein [Stutzerimonas nitrititolerans]